MYRHPWLSPALVLVLLLSGFLATRPVSAQPQSSIHVTTTADGVNEDGLCSLREAILAANTDTQVDTCQAGSGTDTIFLPVGNYVLSLAGAFEDEGLTGDLDISSSLDIFGGSAESTIIDGGEQDRVFHVINSSTTVRLYNLTVRGGVAPGDSNMSRGGGILNQNSTLWLTRVRILENRATNTGGGVDNFGGTLNIVDSTIANNQAAHGGGVFSDNILIVLRSVFTGNSASDTGGAIDNNLQAGIYNVTISGNSAASDDLGQGGGGIFSDGEIQLNNVTLVNNAGRGGFMNQSTARISNTLFAQNDDSNCAGTSPIVSEDNNLDDDGSCGLTKTGDLTVPDARIDVLANNQGLTWTHALLPDSPAVDAGNNSTCLTYDQRGAARPADGNEDGIKVCDIGAYEFNSQLTDLYLPVILH